MSVGSISCVLMLQVPVLSLVWICPCHLLRFLTLPACYSTAKWKELSLSQSCCEGQRVSLILSLPICSHFFARTLETLIISALVSLRSHPSQIALNTLQSFLITTDRKFSLENLFPLLFFVFFSVFPSCCCCFSRQGLAVYFKLTLICGFFATASSTRIAHMHWLHHQPELWCSFRVHLSFCFCLGGWIFLVFKSVSLYTTHFED